MTGEKLKKILFDRKIRGTDAAEKLGISQQTFAAVFYSKDIKSSIIERLAVAFNIPLSEFYTDLPLGSLPSSVSVNSNNTNNGHDMHIGDCASLVDRALSEIAEQRKLAQSAIDLANKLSSR